MKIILQTNKREREREREREGSFLIVYIVIKYLIIGARLLKTKDLIAKSKMIEHK